MAGGKRDKKRKSKSRARSRDAKTGEDDNNMDGGVELVAMGKSRESKVPAGGGAEEPFPSPDRGASSGDETDALVPPPSKTERASAETTWQFDSTGKMTIQTAPTDAKVQQGVPESCGGKMLFFGSIVWLILVVIGIEVLCLYMGTCFAYDNPSVSRVVTGAIFPLFIVVALVATAGIITAQGISEDMLKTESRSRLTCHSVTMYFAFAVAALIALAYFTAVSLQGIVAVAAVDAVDAGLALTWDSLTYQQQRLFEDDEDVFNDAKQTNMAVVAVFGMALVVNGFLVVSGCGSEVARMSKLLQEPQLF